MIEKTKEEYNKKIGELYAVIESQEKIIRDLQEEVKGYQKMYFDKVMIVNKAIEYIKESEEEYGYLEDCEKTILEILEGGDNNR